MQNKVARSVALALWNNLHSFAGENIISSLMVASLNECRDLRAWLIKRITGRSPKCDGIHFGASVQFPKCLIKNKLIFTDVMAWDCTKDTQWERFEGKGNKHNTRALAKGLWGIYIEVKHTWLKSDDVAQYRLCAAALKRTEARHLFFAVLSGHSEQNVARIKQEKSRNKQESNWLRIFEDTNICHLTLEEVYRQLYNLKSGRSAVALPILREYLNLYLNPEDLGHWKARFEYYRKAKFTLKKVRTDLKSSIYQAIMDIGTGQGFVTTRRPRADSVHLVTFTPDSRSFKVGCNGSGLEVQIVGAAKNIRFGEVLDELTSGATCDLKTAEIISQLLNSLRKKLSA